MEMSVILKLLASDSDDDFLIGVEFLKKQKLNPSEIDNLVLFLNGPESNTFGMLFYSQDGTIGRFKFRRSWGNVSTTTRII